MTKKTPLTIYRLYQLLLEQLGPLGTWPGDSKEEIIVGSFLVQNTRWENVERSLINLKQHLSGDFKSLKDVEQDTFQDLIRPSGFYRNKSKALQRFFNWLSTYQFDYDRILQEHGQDLRSQLLAQFGVGEETADVLLLYVFEQPIFVADKYAQKLFSQLTGKPFSNYTDLKRVFPSLDAFSLEEAQEFHILIDEFGKRYFTPRTDFSQSFLSDDTISEIHLKN